MSASPEGIRPDHYRHVLGHFATGVAVVTALSEGKPIGMTVQAFSALSLSPPMVLFCARRGSRSWAAIADSGRLCVNLLHEQQSGLAVQFARSGRAKFQGVEWSPSAATGSPVLRPALAWIDCLIRETHPGGDHMVVMCDVVDLGADTSGRPLLFYRSEYQRLG
ncbi:MAG TPA: flavin reductase family protein [Candidatus Nitrosotalea sp.]|nr:flavin reductase family protein [Candidatus Nitrosotalea sp.]